LQSGAPATPGDGNNARTRTLTYLTQPPSRALRPRAPRASRHRGSRERRPVTAARSGRSHVPARPATTGHAMPRAAAASRGCAPPRCPSPSVPRSRAAAHLRHPAETSTARGTASKRTGRAGRPRRSLESERGGSGGARSPIPGGSLRSGGKPLATLGAAALQDQAPGARRHTSAEAVLALPPSYVGLIGPLHEVSGARKRRPGRPRAASIDEVFCPGSPQGRCGQPRPGKAARRVLFRSPPYPFRGLLSTPVESRVEVRESPANRLVFASGEWAAEAVVRPPRRCYARLSLSSMRELGRGGWSNRLS
jgi:hypothetical protein